MAPRVSANSSARLLRAERGLVCARRVASAARTQVAVTKLIETAAAKWRHEEGDYRDDITAIVIMLDKIFDKAP